MTILLVIISGIVILTLLAIIGFLKFKSNGKKKYRRFYKEENSASTQIDIDEPKNCKKLATCQTKNIQINRLKENDI